MEMPQYSSYIIQNFYSHMVLGKWLQIPTLTHVHKLNKNSKFSQIDIWILEKKIVQYIVAGLKTIVHMLI